MPAKTETRNYAAKLELRDITKEGGALRQIVGRPAVFNVRSEDLGGFVEVIEPGAFTKTLKEYNAKSLWNHNPDMVLGSVRAGTMSIAEDADGLVFSVDPPDTTWARDAMTSLDRGDVDQMSFGFQSIRESWEYDQAADMPIRHLHEVRLLEVSPVAFPAYPQTECSLRSVFGTESKEEIRAKIEALRNPPAPAEHHPEGAKETVKPDYSYQERRLKLSGIGGES
jgi:HK97 family phage prohead protease